MEKRGIEPRIPECKTGVLPLALQPHATVSPASHPVDGPRRSRARGCSDRLRGLGPRLPTWKEGVLPITPQTDGVSVDNDRNGKTAAHAQVEPGESGCGQSYP